jgi:hypothetical protein
LRFAKAGLDREPPHSFANFIRASSAGPERALATRRKSMEMEKIHVFARSLLSTHGDKAEGAGGSLLTAH